MDTLQLRKIEEKICKKIDEYFKPVLALNMSYDKVFVKGFKLGVEQMRLQIERQLLKEANERSQSPTKDA